MKLKEGIVDEVIRSDLGVLYDHFVIVLDEYDKELAEKQYKKVRYGINILFSIYDEIEGTRITQKGNTVILVNPYSYERYEVSIESYRTEVEDRRNVMIKAIYDNMEDGETLKTYGEK